MSVTFSLVLAITASNLAVCSTLDLSLPEPEEVAPSSSVSLASLRMRAELLAPQIEAVLTTQFGIQKVDWQASPHHQWPTDYVVSAETWAELLRRILEPYDLQLVLYPNHAAVIRYRDGRIPTGTVG